jgi:transposase
MPGEKLKPPERRCPRCGHPTDLKAGVVFVCPYCGHVVRAV